MEVKNLHPWQVSVREASLIQEKLRSRIKLETPCKFEIRKIAAVDVAYEKETAIACAVCFNFPGLDLLEESVIFSKTFFPYIPGLLAFREGPAAIKALEKIKEADLLLFDGHGIAHPRRVGIATHLGICFNKPSIGCAKSILTGRVYPAEKKNKKILPVYDGKEKVGFALKIKEKGGPLFVSPGHLIDFETTLNIIPALLRGHKIPEPLRIAHIYANRYKKEGRNGENKKNCSCLFRRT